MIYGHTHPYPFAHAPYYQFSIVYFYCRMGCGASKSDAVVATAHSDQRKSSSTPNAGDMQLLIERYSIVYGRSIKKVIYLVCTRYNSIHGVTIHRVTCPEFHCHGREVVFCATWACHVLHDRCTCAHVSVVVDLCEHCSKSTSASQLFSLVS